MKLMFNVTNELICSICGWTSKCKSLLQLETRASEHLHMIHKKFLVTKEEKAPPNPETGWPKLEYHGRRERVDKNMGPYG